MTYPQFFQSLTSFLPYPWQRTFSQWTGETVAVVSAPTGAGKEAGAVVPWLYGHSQDADIPRRLIYCLPTRSLVDQVYSNIKKLVQESGLDIQVYCLKGGLIEQGYEECLVAKAILVGTQDQLLTRALNRGYSVPWSQRPKHAGALNNDCRWILDETQLMGVGYPTAIQLHQLRQQLTTYGRAELAVMSATMDTNPLLKYDCSYDEYRLSDEDHHHPYLGPKLTKSKPLTCADAQTEPEIAALAIANHQPDTLTLIVLNTVGKARAVGDCLKASPIPVLVLHSRFLGWKRSELQKLLYSFAGIVVATQVVEAGIDIDARVLITDLCPWPSFKQRVGRCGRTNMDQDSQVFWLSRDIDPTDKNACLPYTPAECLWTAAQLQTMTDVGLLPLDQVEAPVEDIDAHWIEEREIKAFFTRNDPSFTATHCVRDATNVNCRVFWSATRPKSIPHQDSLCPVPVYELEKLVKGQSYQPYVWNDGWKPQTSQLAPGDVVWLPYEAGGYDDDLGWTGEACHRPSSYELKEVKFYDDDPPFPHWLTLDVHSGDAAERLEAYRSVLSKWMSETEINQLVDCARWHDWGKSHEIWQRYANGDQFGDVVAKATMYNNPKTLNGYRHELASAIAAGQHGAPFLAQYVIAAHHGKVRETLEESDGQLNRKAPRGVVLGSKLPTCTLGGQLMPETVLSFDPDQWKNQVRQLLKKHGVFKLWYLETLIRNADVEASRLAEAVARRNAKN